MSSQNASQEQSPEWHEQWSMFHYDDYFLFKDWIAPATIEDFRYKDVLECGCGGGQHTAMVAAVADSVTAVDLNTIDIAKERNKENVNVTFVEADLASMDIGRQFDVVFCIGVIHHTDNPDKTFQNIAKHCKPGGKVIVWCYSSEGNFLVEYGVEPIRKMFLKKMSRDNLATLSRLITLVMYPFVYSIYLLPFLSFLPFFSYFKNFRKMDFERNVLNVFDKLNAPQTDFITKKRAESWFSESIFQKSSISIRHYAGVSWSLVGTKMF